MIQATSLLGQVMLTQLAVRHIMAAAGCASINIICEKVAFQVSETAGLSTYA